MSGEEDFLARWSRRKRAADEPTGSEPAQSPAVSGEKNFQGKTEIEGTKPETEFDLSTLPSIESITSATDVTMFLRAGVPAELTRAALRRAWVADPQIRDFVGLAEYAWDFTKPNEMAGFGPIGSAEEVRKLLAEVMGDNAEDAFKVMTSNVPAEQAQEPVSTNDSRVVESPANREPGGGEIPAAETRASAESDSASGSKEGAAERPVNFAMQQESQDANAEKQPPQRTHGGALPH
jgi:hypothetical protein